MEITYSCVCKCEQCHITYHWLLLLLCRRVVTVAYSHLRNFLTVIIVIIIIIIMMNGLTVFRKKEYILFSRSVNKFISTVKNISTTLHTLVNWFSVSLTVFSLHYFYIIIILHSRNILFITIEHGIVRKTVNKLHCNLSVSVRWFISAGCCLYLPPLFSQTRHPPVAWSHRPYTQHRKFTDHFSGPGRVIGPVCVCERVSWQWLNSNNSGSCKSSSSHE